MRFYIIFPKNWTTNFTSKESARFTESVTVFLNQKFPYQKDIPVSIPGIQPSYREFANIAIEKAFSQPNFSGKIEQKK